MAIDPEKLKSLQLPPQQRTYTRRDSRLYALSLGFGTDPMLEAELDFASDRKGFKAVPTMATIFADVILELTQACNLQRPELALHGQQKLEWFAPLPGAAKLEITGSIPQVYDRGADKGAEIHMLAEARIPESGQLLYRTTYVTIARGDGGFGGDPSPGNAGAASTADIISSRSPDHRYCIQTLASQALLYSLNGDPNPIHTQPRVALKAGFSAPILHGLCTYGMAFRALMACCCEYDCSNARQFDVRFSAPVIPGELLEFEFWRADDGILFRARSRQSQRLVLKDGIYRTT